MKTLSASLVVIAGAIALAPSVADHNDLLVIFSVAVMLFGLFIWYVGIKHER